MNLDCLPSPALASTKTTSSLNPQVSSRFMRLVQIMKSERRRKRSSMIPSLRMIRTRTEDGYEEATYHVKDLREQKLRALPTGFRSWKNGVLTQFGRHRQMKRSANLALTTSCS